MLVNEFLQQNIVDEVRVVGRDDDRIDVRNVVTSLLFDRERASEVTEQGLLDKLETVKLLLMGGKSSLKWYPSTVHRFFYSLHQLSGSIQTP